MMLRSYIALCVAVLVADIVVLLMIIQSYIDVLLRVAVTLRVLWVIVSFFFSVVVWRLKGPQHGLDFLTGYLIEYSLSVDNIFVFVLIFAYFRVPPRAQHRVLVWGIVGALVMRGSMIWCGIALVQRFHFVLYLFGAFLLIRAARMLSKKQPARDITAGWFLRTCRGTLPMTRE